MFHMESPRIWDLETRQSMVIDIDHRITSLALNDSGLLAIGTDRGVVTMQLSSGWVGMGESRMRSGLRTPQ